MKREKYSNEIADSSAVDAKLRALLQEQLPQSNENQWFTRRVMNRLPDQALYRKLTIWQWVCYGLSGVGILIFTVLAYRWLVAIPLSFQNILIMATVLFALIIAAGLMTVPGLIRILRD
jgi:hypothetical protein